MLMSVSPTSVLSSIGGGSFCFLGFVSFEERATAWAEFIAKNEARPDIFFLVDYDTTALPANRDFKLRERCRAIFSETFAPAQARVFDHTNAFAVNPLTDLTAQILEECEGLPLLVDISCMTRVHLFALVAALYGRKGPTDIRFCYTVPVSYGFRREDRLGWRDVLFIPIGNRWVFKREGQSRGIILAGHDAERLSVALGELEPASGSVVYCGNPKRPDFLRRAREVNEHVERRLRHLRMPRSSGPPGSADGWNIECIDVGDFRTLSNVLWTQVKEARHEECPVILFPFGPKPDSLAVALLLREWNVEDAWAVYPVPESFSTTYSTSAAELQVFRPVHISPLDRAE